jgi:hypothetical protein
MTQKILHPRFMNLLLFQLPIMMVFLAPPLPALLFFLFVILVRHGLHHILQLVIHNRHFLDHFHF